MKNNQNNQKRKIKDTLLSYSVAGFFALSGINILWRSWQDNKLSEQFKIVYKTQPDGTTIMTIDDKVVPSGGGGENPYSLILKDGNNEIGRVTQGYGKTLFAVRSGFYPDHTHHGVDFVFKDSRIPSPAKGTIIGVRDSCTAGDRSCGSGYGNNVIIEDTEGNKHYLSHLQDISVSVGSKVAVGQIIGTQGNTGASTGAHLDYRIFSSGGSRLNPMEFHLNFLLNDWDIYLNYWKDKPLHESLEHSIRENIEVSRLGIKYGCATEIMTAIWYRESNFARTNPSNGQGIFQMLSGGFSPSATIDFEFQVKQACEHLRGKVGGADLTSIDTDEQLHLVALALGRYNGINGKDWWNGAYVVNELTDWWWFSDENSEMLKCAYDFCRNGIMVKDKQLGALTIIAWMKGNNYK